MAIYDKIRCTGGNDGKDVVRVVAAQILSVNRVPYWHSSLLVTEWLYTFYCVR